MPCLTSSAIFVGIPLFSLCAATHLIQVLLYISYPPPLEPHRHHYLTKIKNLGVEEMGQWVRTLAMQA